MELQYGERQIPSKSAPSSTSAASDPRAAKNAAKVMRSFERSSRRPAEVLDVLFLLVPRALGDIEFRVVDDPDDI